MENLKSNLTDTMDGFIHEKVDFSKYEASFRRWLVCEIESGRILGKILAQGRLSDFSVHNKIME